MQYRAIYKSRPRTGQVMTNYTYLLSQPIHPYQPSQTSTIPIYYKHSFLVTNAGLRKKTTMSLLQYPHVSRAEKVSK